MCGIAGIVRGRPRGVRVETLARMAAALRHRGPDGYGFYAGARVGLAHVRLSILDVACGAQPLANEDGRLLIIYNGEVYNYIELRRELQAAGHRFATRSDTEVLVHGYEQWGEDLLPRLNGQFAFALYDRRDESVLFARDRFGVRPLFYAERGEDLVFASEAKALFASGEVEAAPDPAGLAEVFTFWAAIAPRTVFRGVRQLEPGTLARWRDGRLVVRRWFSPGFPEARREDPRALQTLDGILRDAVALRMRADVPVGGYLSGGLDSTITCTLASALTPHDLRTFSVAFADPALDESAHQRAVAAALDTRHAVQHIAGREIAEVFPAVVRHAETPLVRSAPAPLYLLARLTREHGIKVVLTGEGADEMLLGYDVFKEVAIRAFCLRQPGSAVRPRLFDRLYPYLGQAGRGGEFWRRAFLDAGDSRDALVSHLPRIRTTSWIASFYTDDLRATLAGFDPLAERRAALPAAFADWSPMNRAAFLEQQTLLAGYLLSSQGDRMAMAHGVEGRFPFLDPRLSAFAAALPERSKLRGLREKDILRRWAAAVVPAGAAERPKQPYRAPDAPAFFAAGAPEWVGELLDAPSVAEAGVFAPRPVAALAQRCRDGRATGFRENQALVAVLSTQLWHRTFIGALDPVVPLAVDRADVRIVEASAPAPTLP